MADGQTMPRKAQPSILLGSGRFWLLPQVVCLLVATVCIAVALSLSLGSAEPESAPNIPTNSNQLKVTLPPASSLEVVPSTQSPGATVDYVQGSQKLQQQNSNVGLPQDLSNYLQPNSGRSSFEEAAP